MARNLEEKRDLKSFYLSLPDASYPRLDFVKKVMQETGVTQATVRNWVLYGKKPSNRKFVEVLCSLTGLLENELWK